jgi:Uma2 family endonuclease
VRCELIEGEILTVPPIGSRHVSITARLTQRLFRSIGDVANVRSSPVDLGADSEPESDVLVLKPRADDYMRANPRPADVLLLIEVSDSTLAYDRNDKRDLYAKYGISEYWVVDVNNSLIAVYYEPIQGAYQRTREYTSADAVSPQAFPSVRISVAELFA